MGGGWPIQATEHIKKKFEGCKNSLSAWSNEEFKHNVVEINKVKKRLNIMSKQPRYPKMEDEERALKSRLYALWKRE